MRAELVAQLDADQIGLVVGNDHLRHSFTVVAGTKLHAVRGEDLSILHTWPLGDAGRGSHSTSPAHGVALVSGPDRVSLLEADGAMRWSYRHTPWSGARVAGCAWFDGGDRPLAVIPATEDERCQIVHLDVETGRLIARRNVEGKPAGVEPIHQADGWVGLSEGEGQDAARAWWVRFADRGDLEFFDAGWEDQVLADVNADGTQIVTVPHRGDGPLAIRTFPGLTVTREVHSPDSEKSWDFVACFVGQNLVGRLLGENVEATVAIGPKNEIHALDVGDGWLVPAADSWLTVERTRLCRWVLT